MLGNIWQQWNVNVFTSAMLLQTNTFQAVLTTDGRMSFVMLHYGNMSWTTGVLSGGDHRTGLGGNAAVVSYNDVASFKFGSCPMYNIWALIVVRRTKGSQHSQEYKDPCRHCFCDWLDLWPFDPKINGFPGLIAKRICVKFGDPSCIDIDCGDIVQINRQTKAVKTIPPWQSS